MSVSLADLMLLIPKYPLNFSTLINSLQLRTLINSLQLLIWPSHLQPARRSGSPRMACRAAPLGTESPCRCATERQRNHQGHRCCPPCDPSSSGRGWDFEGFKICTCLRKIPFNPQNIIMASMLLLKNMVLLLFLECQTECCTNAYTP